jgi:type I restriction enzyme R subunit
MPESPNGGTGWTAADGLEPPTPDPCPVCGHLPCTCPGGQPKKKKVVVKLSKLRELTLHTEWDERIQFGDELLTIEEYIKRLFGMLPTFLDGEEDLRERWSQPESRQKLLEVLEESGFPEDKLEMTRRFLELEQCDMLDVLAFLAYNTTPMERQRRAEILQAQAIKQYSKAQQDFVNYIMQLYVRNGFKELGSEKLPTLIQMKYHSPHDAVKELKMQPAEIRQFFLGMQQQLYKGMGTVNVEIHNHYHGNIETLNIKE